MTGSAGQKRVPTVYFAENPFPLQLLAEQRRIVAKIDQLLALCDSLSRQIELATEKRVAVLDALISRV